MRAKLSEPRLQLETHAQTTITTLIFLCRSYDQYILVDRDGIRPPSQTTTHSSHYGTTETEPSTSSRGLGVSTGAIEATDDRMSTLPPLSWSRLRIEVTINGPGKNRG